MFVLLSLQIVLGVVSNITYTIFVIKDRDSILMGQSDLTGKYFTSRAVCHLINSFFGNLTTFVFLVIMFKLAEY